jgi:[acyl-carrier-protein] S-malonyltransferase
MQLVHTAFVFPGQGSQTVGMARDVFERFPVARELLAEADDVLGYPLSRIFLEGPDEALRRTANTQPAILIVSIAIQRALGLTPALVAGHSLGEYSALVVAGAIRFRDAVTVVHKRGGYMQEAVPEGEGTMLALVGADTEAIVNAIARVDGVVDIANYNAPGQVVIAGAREATRAVAEKVGARQVVELPVSAPFHCRLMQPAEVRLAADLRLVEFHDLTIPLYTNVDARKVSTAEEARRALERQVSRPVRWTELIQRAVADDQIETFVEIGPGKVLSGLIRRIDRNVRRLSASDCAGIEAVRNQLAH